MNNNKFISKLVKILIFLLLVSLTFFITRQVEQAKFTKSISSIKQTYFWIIEYKEMTSREPSNLKEVIKYFTTKFPSHEYNKIIISLDNGTLKYKEKPALGEPMIEWKINTRTIKLMDNGNVTVTNKSSQSVR